MHRPERPHLRLEGHAEALQYAAATLGHQGDDLRGGCRADVLDEVSVLWSEASAADGQAIAAGLGEQEARGASLRATQPFGLCAPDPAP